jgi:hypothetical protein
MTLIKPFRDMQAKVAIEVSWAEMTPLFFKMGPRFIVNGATGLPLQFLD